MISIDHLRNCTCEDRTWDILVYQWERISTSRELDSPLKWKWKKILMLCLNIYLNENWTVLYRTTAIQDDSPWFMPRGLRWQKKEVASLEHVENRNWLALKPHWGLWLLRAEYEPCPSFHRSLKMHGFSTPAWRPNVHGTSHWVMQPFVEYAFVNPDSNPSNLPLHHF